MKPQNRDAPATLDPPPPKEMTHPCPSIILGVYTPQIIDGSMSVNYFWGCRPPK